MKLWFHVGTRSGLSEKLAILIKANRKVLQERKVRYFLDGSEQDFLRALANNQVSVPDGGLDPHIVFDCKDGEQRIMLDNQHYLGAPNQILGNLSLYPSAEERISRLTTAFPFVETHILLTAHPISSLAGVVKNAEFRRHLKSLGWAGAYELSWWDLVQRIRRVAPHAQFHIADAKILPATLPHLFRAMAGIPVHEALVKEFAWLLSATASSPKLQERYGTQQMNARLGRSLKKELGRSRPATPPDEVMNELGWDKTVIELLNNNFNSDLAKLRSMAWVTVWD